MQNKLIEIQEALYEFIIRASKKGASGSEVQALPEAAKALIESVKCEDSSFDLNKIMKTVDESAEQTIKKIREASKEFISELPKKAELFRNYKQAKCGNQK